MCVIRESWNGVCVSGLMFTSFSGDKGSFQETNGQLFTLLDIKRESRKDFLDRHILRRVDIDIHNTFQSIP